MLFDNQKGSVEILAACKDVGGANVLLPIMDLLKKSYQIRWIAQDNGRGKDVLKGLGCEFELFSLVENISQSNVMALISSMCSTAGQALISKFKGLALFSWMARTL